MTTQAMPQIQRQIQALRTFATRGQRRLHHVLRLNFALITILINGVVVSNHSLAASIPAPYVAPKGSSHAVPMASATTSPLNTSTPSSDSATAATSNSQSKWPTPTIPDDVRLFSIGDQLIVNGMPMQLSGFLSDRPPAQLMEAWRRSLGSQVVQSTVGVAQILGKNENGFYIMVQIRDAGKGSQGTLSITDLGAFARSTDARRSSTAQLLDRLPAGSTITSQLASKEGSTSTRHIVVTNTHSETLNRDAVMSMMNADGYTLEKEVAPDPADEGRLQGAMRTAKTLFFKAQNKEAVAIITRTGDKTALILNTSTTLQGFK